MGKHPRFLQSLAGVMGVTLITYGALSLYTFPGAASLPNQVVRSLIARTLDTAERPLPLASEFVTLQPADMFPPADEISITAPWRIPPTYGVDARQWVSRSAQADSVALRKWLGRRVLVTTRTHADTIHLTWRRLSRVAGCPWVSTLRGTLVRERNRSIHVVRVTGNCPRLSS